MKNVIFNTTDASTHIDNVSDDKFYGIAYENRKGFVTRHGYESGTYMILCKNALTRGNFYCMESNTLRELLVGVNSRDDSVYEFDTANELFKWLAE